MSDPPPPGRIPHRRTPLRTAAEREREAAQARDIARAEAADRERAFIVGGPSNPQQKRPPRQQPQRPADQQQQQPPQAPQVPIRIPEMATEAFRAMVIPGLNGNFEVGISAGVEAELVLSDKLEVFTIAANFAPVTGQPEGAPVMGAVRCVWLADTMRMTLLHLANKCKDLPPALAAYVAGLINPSNVRQVGTMLVAAKVNFFKENHHMGQGHQESGAFVTKAIRAIYPTMEVSVMKTLIHRASHWCSTRSVLKQMGVANVKPFLPITGTLDQLQPSQDVKLRLNGPPAGTARTAIAYNIFKRMIMHPIAAFCPNIGDFNGLAERYARIVESPLSFHIGAAYLCTRNMGPNFRDEDSHGLLGRVGTFGFVYMTKSTLMRSPHIANKQFQTIDDFDPQFHQFCLNWKQYAASKMLRVLKNIRTGGLAISEGYNALCEQFAIAPNPEAMAVVARANRPQGAQPEAQHDDDEEEFVNPDDMEV